MTNPWDVFNTGSVVPFTGNTIPFGWFLCNGAEASRETYPQLFSVIGFKYGGAGDVFKLPNYSGLYLRSVSPERGIAAVTEGTIKKHSHVIHLLKGGKHVHKYPYGGITWAEAGSFGNSRAFPADDGYEMHDGKPYFKQNMLSELGGEHTHQVTLDETGGAENHPKNIGVSFIIKY